MITTFARHPFRTAASAAVAALLSVSFFSTTPTLATPTSSSSELESSSIDDSTGSTPPGSSEPIPAEDLAAGERINDPECIPAAEHPTPVLLLHGTSDNYTHVLPTARALLDRGYCVWAYTYGQGGIQVQNLKPGAAGLTDITESAHEIAGHIEHIQQVTGAEKIDLVGHSQGALITKIYMQQLGGAENVRRVVGLGGSFHGTDFNGLGSVARFFIDAMPPVMEFFLSKASAQQVIGSQLINELNKLPDTTAGVTYTSLYTPIDDTVTPNSASQLEAVPGADVANVNTTLACPNSPQVEHDTMPRSPVTIGLTIWGLERAEGEHTPAPGTHCAP